jgi:hypothetical protein
MTVARVSLVLSLACYFFATHSSCSAFPDHKDERDGEYLKPFVHKPKPNKHVYKDFRIQYLVITGAGEAYQHRAENIWSTWGQSVGKTNNDSVLFISDTSDHNTQQQSSIMDSRIQTVERPTLSVLDILESWDISQRYRQSQLKWMRALVLSDSFPAFDWLILIDDDTFLIHHAMREMLQRYDSNHSLMLAKKNGEFSVSGGAGIVMSKRMVQEVTSPKHRFKLIHAFETAVNDLDNNRFYSDVILSKFIYDHNIGNIINLRELKNEGSRVIMEWYKRHPEANKSAVITFHHISNTPDYLALYNYYYKN